MYGTCTPKCAAYSDQQTAAGWRTLAYDRWGYGRSDERPAFEPQFLRADADEAIRLLDHLGLERLAVVGHSDGGSLGLLLAAEHAQRVERLVLVAAHIDRESATLDGLLTLAQDIRRQPLLGRLRREIPALISAEVLEDLTNQVKELQDLLEINPEQIYLTGFLEEGNGSWELGLAHPEIFAALAPVGGWSGYPFSVPKNICDLKTMPIWAFHGADDKDIHPALNKCLWMR